MTATSAVGPPFASASVEVLVSPPPIVVTVIPPVGPFQTGGSYPFRATVTGTATQTVSWSVRDAVGNLSGNVVSTGNLTASYTPDSTPGTYYVFATVAGSCPTCPTTSGNAMVTVTDPFIGTWTGAGEISFEGTGYPGGTISVGIDAGLGFDQLLIAGQLACDFSFGVNAAQAQVTSPTMFTVDIIECGPGIAFLACPATSITGITITGAVLTAGTLVADLNGTVSGTISPAGCPGPSPLPFTATFTGAMSP